MNYSVKHYDESEWHFLGNIEASSYNEAEELASKRFPNKRIDNIYCTG